MQSDLPESGSPKGSVLFGHIGCNTGGGVNAGRVEYTGSASQLQWGRPPGDL